MMKRNILLRYFLLLALLTTSAAVTAQPAPTWSRAAQIGGTGNDLATAVATDASGNTVAVGLFEGTIQVGTVSLVCPVGSSKNLYLVKYSPQGVVLWAQRAGDGGAVSNFGTEALSVTTDGADNIYIAGDYSGTVTFGTTTLSGFAGGASAFLAKFSPTGASLWARTVRAPSGSVCSHITTDALGNVFIAGYYSGTATFGTLSITSQGGTDAFIAKYDAQGAAQWVRSLGGAQTDLSYGAQCDAQGNVYICGSFNAAMTVGTNSLTSNGGTDGYLAKYDAQGGVVWARGYGGPGDDRGVSIAVDNSGNVYVGGTFSGVAIFGPTAALIGLGGTDGFLMQHDGAGNVQWVSQAGGTGNDELNDVAIPSSGIIYATGSFNSSASIGAIGLVSAGGADLWVARFDRAGAAVWAARGGGNQNDYPAGLATTGNGTLSLTATFTGTTQFGTTALTSRGQSDAVVLQLQDNAPLRTKLLVASSWQVYPNPFSNELTVDVTQVGAVTTVSLIDAGGKQIIHDTLLSASGQKTYTLPVEANLQAGIYLLQLKSAGRLIETRRLVKLP